MSVFTLGLNHTTAPVDMRVTQALPHSLRGEVVTA